MRLQLRCFITHPRAANSYLIGYAERLSRFDVRIRCVDVSDPASCLPRIGDDARVYIELPAQRTSTSRRCLQCIVTITDMPATADGGRVIKASIEDMQFRDLPVQFGRDAVGETAQSSTRTM